MCPAFCEGRRQVCICAIYNCIPTWSLVKFSNANLPMKISYSKLFYSKLVDTSRFRSALLPVLAISCESKFSVNIINNITRLRIEVDNRIRRFDLCPYLRVKLIKSKNRLLTISGQYFNLDCIDK